MATPPKNLLLLRIEIPDTLDREEVRQAPANPKMSQQLGDEWLDAADSPVLSVPSVIAPLQRNYLLNPTHHLFRAIRISSKEPFVLDFRLTELLAEELGAS